ncbi:MAG TPA: hypothetical protein VKQ10_06795 [Spirochaetota bacterium]|nr:hypothetical protein [Spirochaetota bacterium]
MISPKAENMRPVLIAIILILTAIGYYAYNASLTPAPEQKTELRKTLTTPVEKAADPAKKESLAHKEPAAISTEAKYDTLDQMKKDYPRLEVIQLYNGRTYSGAIVSIDENFTMITVDGTVKIPQDKVRQREIIR